MKEAMKTVVYLLTLSDVLNPNPSWSCSLLVLLFAPNDSAPYIPGSAEKQKPTTDGPRL